METSNNILVHQAFYGEVDQSHGCIYSTIEDAKLNAFLIGFTDRPGALPAGINMDPYYSATAFSNYFIFSLTIPDNQAKRSGMVFTHALIVSVSDLANINELKILFNHFVTKKPKDKKFLEPIELSIPIVHFRRTTFPKFIQLAIEKLLSEKAPVVFCGKTKSFFHLIDAIWHGAPNTIRSKFTYSACFSAANMDDSKTFIHFQTDLKNQISNIEFISDEFDQEVEIIAKAQKYLLLKEEHNEFNLFIQELAVDLENWSVLQICARAYEAYQQFSGLKNDELRQLIRQIAKISPKADNGLAIKENIITELKHRLINGTEQNLKSLKNIPIESFQSSERQLSIGLTSFLESEFSKELDFNIALVSEIVSIIHNETEQNWWHLSVKSALAKIGEMNNVATLKNVWQVLIGSEELISSMQIYLPNEKHNEESLLRTIPDEIPSEIAKVLAEITRIRKWNLLHARLIQIYLKPKEAVLKQFLMEKADKVTSFVGTESILNTVSDANLLDVTLDSKEDYFIDKYIERTLLSPSLLNKLKTDNSIWLRIWSGNIEQSKELGLGIINLKEKVEQVLMLLSNGVDLPNKLITAISESPFADLSEHKQRSSIWGQLSADVKNKFLQSTADSLISKPNEGTLDMGTIEYDLKTYIYSDEYLNLVLNKHKADISPVLNFYEKFNLSKDIPLAIYIDNYFQQIDPIKAKRLGRIVNRNRMVKTASSIADKATRGNNNWQFALSECSYLLDFFQRVKLKLSGTSGMFHITDNQWWESLEEWIVEYYPSSSSLITIWKKAGGKESELIMNSTPSEVWNDAISKLRRNQFKEITINDLLMEMNKQYGQNQNFNLIYKIRLDYVKQ